ncbi:MAG TPA: DUF1990 domain-containing protein [Acidimicrobiia bacterium]|jgi:uncharacterized protein (UPF0548 family)
MAIHLRPADRTALTTTLESCRDAPLTYGPVGSSLGEHTPKGLHRRVWSVCLDSGAFDRAADSILTWAVHRGSGLSVATDGPMQVGTNVVMNAPLPLGFVDITCRIVVVIDEPDRRGFAYGTLPVHPETGEEVFLAVRDDEGVRFDVRAVSAPRHPLARLAPPLADRLQHTAVRRYLTTMTKLTEV